MIRTHWTWPSSAASPRSSGSLTAIAVCGRMVVSTWTHWWPDVTCGSCLKKRHIFGNAWARDVAHVAPVDGLPGAGGWPVVEDKNVCPKCNSRSIILTCEYGPGGRLGDPGGKEVISCQNCGNTHRYE